MEAKIKKALIFLLNEEDKVSSWGLSNISITETSIEFDVDGLVYTGRIIIKSNNFDYQIIFDDGGLETCSLRNLVNVLDYKIERTGNYLQDLEGWFSENDR